MRFATPPPATAQAIPKSIETSSSETWGRQKQFCPGQAASVLYCPMTIRPPSTLMTVQSASTIIQRSPNQRASSSSASVTPVSSELYQVLNRLARSQPAMPVSNAGGPKSPPADGPPGGLDPVFRASPAPESPGLSPGRAGSLRAAIGYPPPV